jgi:hypothetical protein
VASALETLIVQINGVGVSSPRLVDRGLVVLFFGAQSSIAPRGGTKICIGRLFADLNQYLNGLRSA